MDEFEFNEVPKFINFNEEVENVDSHEKSAYFNNVNLQTPLRAPLPATKADKDVRDCGPIECDLPDLDKENAIPPPHRNDPFKAATSDAVPPAIGGLSNLALFNPKACRVAQQARRRSALHSSSNEKEMVQQGLSAQQPSRRPGLRSAFKETENHGTSLKSENEIPPSRRTGEFKAATSDAVQPAIAGLSNLALFNPEACRVAQQARRRSALHSSSKENGMVQPEKSAQQPTRRLGLRSASKESESHGTSHKPENAIQPSRRTGAFKAPTYHAVPPAIPGLNNRALINSAASRIAQPTLRRSALHSTSKGNQMVQPDISTQQPSHRMGLRSASKENESRVTPLKAANFNSALRNYKAPSGKTPAKPLTLPHPFPFRRSTSRCRDTDPVLDPRIRASVDRLSAPKKRDDASTSKRVPPAKLSGKVSAVVERLSSPLKRNR